MTRTCAEPTCDRPLAAHNVSGVCTICAKKTRLADYMRRCERDRESWYSPADDTPPAEIVRIATGVRV